MEHTLTGEQSCELTEVLSKELSAEVTALLAEYGVVAKLAGGPVGEDPDWVFASLELSNDQIQGALLMRAPVEVLGATIPITRKGGPFIDELLDWGGELCNQLAGRIKNQLGSRGICIRLATPIATRAAAMQVEWAYWNAAGTEWTRFLADGQAVSVRVLLDVDPDFELPERQDAEAASVRSEGLMLF